MGVNILGKTEYSNDYLFLFNVMSIIFRHPTLFTQITSLQVNITTAHCVYTFTDS